MWVWAFLVAQIVTNPPTNAGDPGSIPGLGRLPGEGNGYPLQYACLGNPMDRGAWLATAYGIGKSRARLSDSHTRIVPKVKTVPRSVTTSHFSFLSTLYKQPIILIYPCFFLVKKKRLQIHECFLSLTKGSKLSMLFWGFFHLIVYSEHHSMFVELFLIFNPFIVLHLSWFAVNSNGLLPLGI